jgi:hypothetical protein
MGLARKQARALSRRMSGISTPQAMAALREIRDNSAASMANMKHEVTDTVMKRIADDIRPQILGDCMLLFLAYLRIRKGYGKKRLHDFMLDFNEFGDDAEENGLTSEIVKNMLAEECSTDVVELFSECEIETEKRKKAKRNGLSESH